MESPLVGTPSAKALSGPCWITSSRSFASSNCVEVADLPSGRIGVRSSGDPLGPVLRFSPDEWHAFLAGVKLGEFDSLSGK